MSTHPSVMPPPPARVLTLREIANSKHYSLYDRKAMVLDPVSEMKKSLDILVSVMYSF